jgi:hypothetical protein
MTLSARTVICRSHAWLILSWMSSSSRFKCKACETSQYSTLLKTFDSSCSMHHPSIVHRSPSTFLSPGRCDFTKQQQTAKMTTYASDQNAFFNSSISGFRGYDQDFDMEEDNFTDALEHQTQCDMNEQDFNTKLPDTKATSEAYTPTTTTFAQDPPMFGESILKTKPLTHPKHYNPLAEPEETIRVNKYSASDKHTVAYHSIFKTSPNSFQDQSQSQHNSGCSGSRGASTPPATPRPRDISATDPEPELGFEPKPEGTARVWLGPNDLRDVAKPFLREKRWHEKVAHLHLRSPSLPTDTGSACSTRIRSLNTPARKRTSRG